MTCDFQSLIDDAKCFLNLNPQMLAVTQAQLWCSIAQAIDAASTGAALQSDDGEWYNVEAISLGGGLAAIHVDQLATTPGANSYLVLVNLTDGLKYKFTLVGAPPNVFWEIDPTPTLEAETPTTLEIAGHQYTLDIITDGDLTAQLTPI